MTDKRIIVAVEDLVDLANDFPSPFTKAEVLKAASILAHHYALALDTEIQILEEKLGGRS